jgi:hypothetical protein
VVRLFLFLEDGAGEDGDLVRLWLALEDCFDSSPTTPVVLILLMS